MKRTNPIPLKDNSTKNEAAGGTLIAAIDERIQRDWRRFIYGGFEYEDLSEFLFCTLALYSEFETIKQHRDRREFWGYYFASDTCRLRRFWAYFAGSDECDQPRSSWFETALGQLLAADLATILPTLQRTLTSLYETMYQAEKWHVLIEKQAYLRHSPEQLVYWSKRYDEDHRFPTYEEWLGVNAEVRRFLRLAAQTVRHQTSRRPVLLFETARRNVHPLRVQANYPLGAVARIERLRIVKQLPLSQTQRKTAGRAQQLPDSTKKGRRHAAQD